jgi:dephospho-CoA kinase
LLGGIGSGKSFVSRRLTEICSAAIVDADELAHEALDACARDGRLEEALGPGFVKKDGRADRSKIARRVFQEAPALRALERLTHPVVGSMIQERIHDHREGSGPSLLVLDVPLLIEVGLDRLCDALWFVDAPEELRLERAGKNGLSAEDVRRRESHQSPLERKRARADRVVPNDRAPADLDRDLREGLLSLGIRP